MRTNFVLINMIGFDNMNTRREVFNLAKAKMNNFLQIKNTKKTWKVTYSQVGAIPSWTDRTTALRREARWRWPLLILFLFDPEKYSKRWCDTVEKNIRKTRQLSQTMNGKAMRYRFRRGRFEKRGSRSPVGLG